jgi:hypothetical protein
MKQAAISLSATLPPYFTKGGRGKVLFLPYIRSYCKVVQQIPEITKENLP